LQSLDGCWKSNGQVLFSNQTYFNTSATTSAGPYDLCVKCLPPPTPVPVIPSGLCLNQTVNSTSTLINFYSAGTLNGYMTWTSATPSYKIFYNSGTTKWILSGYTIIEPKHGGKHLHQHEYEFHNKEDLARFLNPYFQNIQVFSTTYPDRINLYFYASNSILPFEKNNLLA
jgi:hypothetical protein